MPPWPRGRASDDGRGGLMSARAHSFHPSPLFRDLEISGTSGTSGTSTAATGSTHPTCSTHITHFINGRVGGTSGRRSGRRRASRGFRVARAYVRTHPTPASTRRERGPSPSLGTPSAYRANLIRPQIYGFGRLEPGQEPERRDTGRDAAPHRITRSGVQELGLEIQ